MYIGSAPPPPGFSRFFVRFFGFESVLQSAVLAENLCGFSVRGISFIGFSVLLIFSNTFLHTVMVFFRFSRSFLRLCCFRDPHPPFETIMIDTISTVLWERFQRIFGIYLTFPTILQTLKNSASSIISYKQ